jgi:hypothetical protein
MSKNEDFESNIERYVLKEIDLIALIQGKSFNFMFPNNVHLEIIPPNHGITLAYEDWNYIKSLLFLFSNNENIKELIKKIEERK